LVPSKRNNLLPTAALWLVWRVLMQPFQKTQSTGRAHFQQSAEQSVCSWWWPAGASAQRLVDFTNNKKHQHPRSLQLPGIHSLIFGR